MDQYSICYCKSCLRNHLLSFVEVTVDPEENRREHMWADTEEIARCMFIAPFFSYCEHYLITGCLIQNRADTFLVVL